MGEIMDYKINIMTQEDKEQILAWDDSLFSVYNANYSEMLDYLYAKSLRDYFDRIEERTSGRIAEENRFSFVLKNFEGRIVSFMLCYLMKRDDEKKDLFIQSIATHPHFRKQGYAETLLKETLLNLTEYTNEVTPIDVGCFVDKKNEKSFSLFSKLNFEFMRYNNQLSRVLKDYNEFISEFGHEEPEM